MTLLVIGAVIVLILVTLVGIFNKLVAYKNRYQNAFAQIEVQLKRRHDLIPSLVETVKGYMAHERETLDAVIHARNQAASGLQAAAGDPGGESHARLGLALFQTEQYADAAASYETALERARTRVTVSQRKRQ